MENLNAEVCEICGCMYVVGKPHICHKENSYVPKLNLPRELAREISVKNTIALINSQEQRIGELTEENERLRDELARSYAALDESVNFYCSFTKSKIQNCPIDDEVAKAKADTVREMQERLRQCYDNTVDHMGIYTESQVLFAIDQIAKEMLE